MKPILKNFTNLFTRYRNPFLSLERRFINPDNKSSKRMHDYIHGLKTNNYFQSAKATLFTRKINWLNYNILSLIYEFTLKDVPDEDIDKYIESLKKQYRKIKDIRREGRTKIFIKLKDREIYAKRLTDALVSDTCKLEDFIPNIHTKERTGNCHSYSRKLAQVLNGDCNVVTGSIYSLLSNARILHSWVEEEKDGQAWCFDATLNASMKKEDYYHLYNVKVLEKISKQDIIADKEDFWKLYDINMHYVKLYYSSRQEALDIAKKIKPAEKEVSK